MHRQGFISTSSSYREKTRATSTDAAIVRVEQLYPIHRNRLAELFDKYGHSARLIWCQEEAAKHGGRSWIAPHWRKSSATKRSNAGRDCRRLAPSAPSRFTKWSVQPCFKTRLIFTTPYSYGCRRQNPAHGRIDHLRRAGQVARQRRRYRQKRQPLLN